MITLFGCPSKQASLCAYHKRIFHADHRLSSLDYDTVLKATLFLTRDSREWQKLLVHFIIDEKSVWRVSPAYDLTFFFWPCRGTLHHGYRGR